MGLLEGVRGANRLVGWRRQVLRAKQALARRGLSDLSVTPRQVKLKADSSLADTLAFLFIGQDVAIQFSRSATGRSGSFITAHPLGGCPMSDDHPTGVVDQYGRVHGYEDSLLVLDDWIVPSALGANPSRRSLRSPSGAWTSW